MIHDFSVTDLTERPGYPSYYSWSLKRRIHCTGYKIYDANGDRLYYVVWCDDETGEVRRLDRGADGKFAIDPETKRAVIVTEKRPAPLRVVMMKPGESYLD